CNIEKGCPWRILEAVIPTVNFVRDIGSVHVHFLVLKGSLRVNYEWTVKGGPLHLLCELLWLHRTL
ncbi:unnamed protein product, partial [Toxocara canis]|uniref:Ovule protein n=1 Tax=Toxocara canis TaxID=6265 RepID=A0A183U8Y7_TOXCA